MKQLLQFRNSTIKRSTNVWVVFLFMFAAGSLVAQEITINRTVVASPTLCNQFDVTLEIIGDPPSVPSEVVLIIDRSGSMDDGASPLPIDYAKDAAIEFVENLFEPANNPTGLNRVAIVSYAASASLDIGLTSSAGEQDVIDAINDITTGGNTNIQSGLVRADQELTNNGTFDCSTSRSIVLLTDGVTNRDNSGNSCSNTGANTICQQNAIQAGINAQTTVVSGVTYNQNVFSVGLFGAISGSQQTIATNTIDAIQNAGLYTTETGADLSGIYTTILGQLAAAAKAVPGEALVTNSLSPNFNYVAGSISTNKGSASFSGSLLSWFVDQVNEETITLQYSIEAAVIPGACGVQNSGNALLKYIDSNCNVVETPFNNPSICVPCPDLTDPVLDQLDCTNSVDYSATFDTGACTPFSTNFEWEFFLNNVSVGTTSGSSLGDLSGTFVYAGAPPFEGDFRAELTFSGVYNNCSITPISVSSTIPVYVNPDAPISGGDQIECADTPTVQTLTATASVDPGDSIVWYDAAINGSVVLDPSLSSIGSVTYYAETIDGTSGCSSADRTPVTLTLYNCAISIEKSAVPNNTTTCNPIPAGGTIAYTFTVANEGNVEITGVEVNDPLIDPVNPIPGPASGDLINPGVLDVGEVWTYLASYTVTQADIVNGEVMNTAEVDGTVTGSSSSYNVNDDDSVTVELCQNAEISISKASVSATGTCNNFEVNDQIDYTFVVMNEGDVDITDVVVTDAILGGVIAGPASGDLNNDSILNVGEVWGYVASYTITQTDIDNGSVINTAEVNGNTALNAVDDTSNEVTVLICQNPDIALIKVGSYDGFDPTGACIAAPGDVITYTFSVKNTGNVTLSNVMVTDAGVTMVGGPIASLAPGAEDTTTFTASYVLTQADIDAGEYSNQALATGTPPSGPDVTDASDDNSYVEDEPTITDICNAASIALIKVGSYDGFDPTGACIAAPGDVITYTFSVKNTGNVTLSNVIVTDAGVTMVGGPIASLAPGAEDTTTFTASYVLTQADIDAGEYSNQALATGTPPSGPDVTDASDDNSYVEDEPTITDICNAASIALIKVGSYDGFDPTGACIAAPGDVITYTFSVKNTGNVTLSNVMVTDAGVTMVGGPIASLAPGAEDTTTFTASYVLTQADIDAGEYSNQALATGTPPSGPDVTDASDDNSYVEDEPTITDICNAASIALIKVGSYDGFDPTGACIAAPGDVITYTFSVKNTGNVTLSNVIVTDAGVTMVGGPIASLAPGAEDTTTFTASYVLTQADIDAGEYSNQALATGTPPSGPDVTDASDDNSYVEDEPTITDICNAASIALIKVGSYDGFDPTGACIAAPGDVITYTFSVKNTGNVTLSNVIVTDAGVTMVGGPIASLAPGAEDTTTFTASYVLTQADIDAGEYSNQALATGTPPSGPDVTDASDDNSYVEDEPTITDICNAASIALIKVSSYDGFDPTGACIAAPGDVITYTFSVKNTGNVTLSNVIVTDAGVTMVGGPIASLAPGAEDTTTFTASYVLTQADIDAGEYSNQALATGTPPSGPDVTDASDDNSYVEDEPTITDICNAASIALIKVGSYDGFDPTGACIAAPGDVITYTFSVKNTGNVTLSNVIVTDAGVTMVGGPIASLAPGAEDTTTFTASYVLTQADIDAGEYSNQALATGTPPSGPDVTDASDDNSYVEDEPTITDICNAASIALIKVGSYDGFDPTGACIAAPGDVITYTFSVKNTGNVTLSNVIVTDAGVTMVGGPIASLAPGAEDTTTFTASYVLTQADIDAGEYSNQALATGTPPSGPDVTDASDDNSYVEDEPTITDICNAASIALIKVGSYDGFDPTGACIAAPGDVITYTFSVKNTGNVTLSNVIVTDAGVTMLGGPIASLAPGAEDTTTFTASYVLTQADIDAGEYSNQALATGTPPSGPDVTDASDDNSYVEDEPTITDICQLPVIAIVKTGVFVDGNGNQCSDPGESIDYTFTVTNEGNVSLSAISVTDPLVAPITFVSGDTDGDTELDVTETWIYTASYAITQADIDAGQVTNQATAEGTAPDSTVVSDLSDDTSVLEDDPTVTPLCQSADIAIIKTGVFVDGNGNQCADPGEAIDYTFTVTNEGNVSLSAISVTDPLVAPITFVSGDTDGDTQLDVTETWIYTGSYAITQVDIDAGQVTNQAPAEGTAPDTTVVSDLSDDTSVLEDDPTVTPLCQNPEIAIVKTGVFVDGNGNQCSDPGEAIDYTFTVTNEGNVSLSAISVTDPLVAPITFVSGDTDGDTELDVTETWIYTGSYAITQADIDAGQVTNQATAEGTAPDSTVVSDLSDDTSVLEDDPTVTPLCQNPDIAIVKTGVFVDGNGNQCADPGEAIDYTFTVTNEGNVSLSAISVTDPLVAPITFVSGDTDGDTQLDVTETWIYTGSYAITQADIDAGQVTNQATAEGTAPDSTVVSDLSDDTSVLEDDPTVTPLCQSPDLAIVKTGVFVDGNGNQCADPGEAIDYTFTVTNEGNVSLSAISVTDPLVAPITFVSGDTDGDNELDVTETWIYTGSYAITQADIDAGQVTNQATAEGTAPDTTVVSDLSDDTSVLEDDPTVTPLCQNPDIAIVKTGVFVDGNGNQCADPGEAIDYTFTVTNEGNVSLSAISVTDPLVAPITFVSGDTDGDTELDVTETWIYTGSYAITQADIDAGQVTNQAMAEGIAPDSTVVSDFSDDTSVLEDDPTVTPLCQSPDIAIVKTGVFVDGNGNQCSDPGESIDYTFTVTNEGNVSLSAISVTDPLVAPITYVSGDTDGDTQLDVTETWIYTGSYAITQADIDAGQVTNQATAEGTAPDSTVVSDLSDNTSVLEDDPTVTPLCQNPEIAIVKTGVFVDGNGNQCSDPGESIDYTFTVTNEGNVSLSAISVTDPLVAPITFVSGDTDGDTQLDVTETWIYTGNYIITQVDIDAGQVTNQATAEGTAPDTTVVSDLSDDTSVLEDDPTVTPLCQNPIISIIKTSEFIDGNGNQCADPGEAIEYMFTVGNEGNVSLINIVVTDPLLGGNVPGPDSGDLDGDNELDVEEKWIYSGSYAITQADIDAGQVINQATAEGTAPDTTVVSDLSDDTNEFEDDPTITPLCQNPDIAIVKTGVFVDGNGNQCADPGESIDYTFTVTNEGNVSLSSISVTDLLVAPITFVSGDTDGDTELDVTETWIFTGSYTITQDDIDAGQVTNQATAEGTAPDSTVVSDLSDDTSVLEDDPTVTPLCQSPDLAIVKTGVFIDGNGNQCADPGELIDYTFTVTNEGNVSLTSIIVDDLLLGGTVPGPVSGDVDGDNELDVTETWIYTASYVITQDDIDAGQVTNQATAEGTAPDGTVVDDLSDNDNVLEDDPTVTPLCQSPDIAIVKTGVFIDGNGNQCADPGEMIDYTFTVTNEGNVSLASIIVDDLLLGGTVPGPVSGDFDGDSELDVTETWIYTASYAITQDDIDAGQVTNQATAEGTAPDGTVVDDLSDDDNVLEDDPTVTPLCQSPDIAIVKTGVFVDGNGNQCADPGELIEYTFTVTNEGNVSLASILLTDPLLGGTFAVPNSGDDDGDNELDVTETWIYIRNYTITQADIDAGQVTNQATAEGTAPDGTVVTDLSDDNSILENDPTVTVLCQNPIIALIKTGTPTDENGNGCIDLGETIVYDFVVTNLGNVDLTGVTVVDPMVTVVGGPISLAAGASDTETFSAVYTVVQADVDAGQVSNQATASGTAPDGSVVTDLSDNNSNFEDDPTVTVLCQDPSMSVEKSGVFNDENADGSAQAGETISYVFTVTNTGNVTLYDIVLMDDLPGIVLEGGPIAVLEPGEIDDSTFTASYTVTEADILAGEVINQAIGTGVTATGQVVEDTSDDPQDLTNIDPNGDGEPDDPTRTILPIVNPEVPFEIFNGITPDGDGLNDFMKIVGIEEYPDNNMKIFNRWGVLVWETDGYGGSDGNENVFRGVSNGRATVREEKELPTGTYYYVLTILGEDNPGQSSYSGYLYINR